MDLYKAIRELHKEKQRLEQVIASLEDFLKVEGVKEAQAAKRRRGRKSMGPRERLEVSERMKKYWAARRKATLSSRS